MFSYILIFDFRIYIVILLSGGVTEMERNLKGELQLMKNMSIKPNFAALGRDYGMDPRTVKKYYEGYEGKPKTRNKASRLDPYKEVIKDKYKMSSPNVQKI